MFVFRFESAYNTLHPDPTPSTTHKNDRDCSATAPTPHPQIFGQIIEMGFSVSQVRESVINSEKWDGRASRPRESFEQLQRRWWERRTRKRFSSTTSTTTLTPIYTRRTFPPSVRTAQCRIGTRSANPEGPMRRLHENTTNDSISITEIQLQADQVVSQASRNELSVLVVVRRVLSVLHLQRTRNPTSAPPQPSGFRKNPSYSVKAKVGQQQLIDDVSVDI
jgi:hypothetical protein